MVNYQLGDTLRRIRESKQLHINELAHRIDVVPRTIYKWENGDRIPPLPVLLKLTEILNCSLTLEAGTITAAQSPSEMESLSQRLKLIEKEVKNMELKLMEIKGDVKFFKDSKNDWYQQLCNGDIQKVKDGTPTYQTMEQCEDYCVKYELNGTQGFSVWRNGINLEDGFWTLKEATDCMGRFLLSEKDIRNEVIEFMDEEGMMMAESHLECWQSRYEEYDSIEDVRWDLDVNHDPSLEWEWVEERLNLELSDDEKNYVEEVFNQAVVDYLRNRWN